MADEPRALRVWIQVTEERMAAVHPADMPALLEKDPEEAARLIAEEVKRLGNG
jgi:hypothetical protein